MLRFKQYLLIEQDIPGFVPVRPQSKPQSNSSNLSNEVKQGTYTITPFQLLVNRLGSRENSLEYLDKIEKRRFEHKNEIDPNWVLPSVNYNDFNKKINVSLGPIPPEYGEKPGLGITPSRVFVDPNTNKIAKIKPNNPEIYINTSETSPRPGGNEIIQKDLKRASKELQPGGKYEKDTGALSDTLWHETQHVLGNIASTDKPIEWTNQTGINYNTVNPNINPQMSSYVTSNVELPAHMSENKMRFYQETGILLDPDFNDKQFDTYKSWLKNDTNKQSQILLQLFNDPNKGKQAKEFLRQIAKTNKSDDGQMMA